MMTTTVAMKKATTLMIMIEGDCHDDCHDDNDDCDYHNGSATGDDVDDGDYGYCGSDGEDDNGNEGNDHK